MAVNRLLIPAAALVAAFGVACGGGSSTVSSSSTAPTASTPSTTTSPSSSQPGSSASGSSSPSGTPMTPTPAPNPSPVPVSGPDNFVSSINRVIGHNTQSAGTVSVDVTANDGQGIVAATGLAQSQSYDLGFCPNTSQNCFAVATFTSDASGSANASFKFPKAGTWAGDFTISQETNQEFATGPNTFSSGINYRAALLPAASVTGGVGQNTGNAGISSGSVVVQGQTIHINATGTTASHTFTVAYCGVPSTCLTQGQVTSDAQGNISADLPANAIAAPVGGTFLIGDNGGIEFAAAFRTP